MSYKLLCHYGVVYYILLAQAVQPCEVQLVHAGGDSLYQSGVSDVLRISDVADILLGTPMWIRHT